jgi:protein phosphatase
MVEGEGRQSYPVPDELRRNRSSELLLPHPIWYASEASPLRPHSQDNEDQVLIDTQRHVIGVFDGMGGEAAGKEASTTSVKIFRSILADISSPDEAVKNLEKGFYVAAQALASAEANNPLKQGMGTTVTVAQVVEGEEGKSVAFLHAGDSRLYVIKRGGRLVQLTTDDNLIQQELESGEITPGQAEEFNARLNSATNWDELGGARGYWSRRNIVMNGIVAEGAAQPQQGTYPLRSEDRLLLATSDGIHDNLTSADIIFLAQHSKPESLAIKLVEAAQDISGQDVMRSKKDDITAVVMKL